MEILHPGYDSQAEADAADLGEAAAMTNLGALLEERSNLKEAEQWYRRGADLGDIS